MPALPSAPVLAPAASTLAPGSWAAFEHDLAAALAAFDREFLIVEVKGSSAYVQLHARRGRFRCEAVSNRFLAPEERLDDAREAALLALGWSPPAEAAGEAGRPRGSPNFVRDFEAPAHPAEIARLVVRTLAEVHRVPGPARLEYASFDADGHEVLLPSLGIPRRPARPEAAAPAAPGPRRAAPARAGRSAAASLRRRVLAELRRGSGDDSLRPDDDGDVGVWLARGVHAFVRVLEHPLAVRVWCPVADGLDATPALLARLHELNATMPLARLVLTDGAVFCAVDVPATPFRVEHLRAAIRVVRRVTGEVRPQVRDDVPLATA